MYQVVPLLEEYFSVNVDIVRQTQAYHGALPFSALFVLLANIHNGRRTSLSLLYIGASWIKGGRGLF
jgi:hypothetical protein